VVTPDPSRKAGPAGRARARAPKGTAGLKLLPPRRSLRSRGEGKSQRVIGDQPAGPDRGLRIKPGEAIRVWAAGHLNKSREVTRSGPYRFVAHPLYLGSSLIGAGLAIGSGNLLVALIVAGYLAITLTAAIRSEEAFLRRIFADEYDEYRHTGIVDTHRRFSLARAIANREHRAVLGLALALLLMAWKATYNRAF